MEKSLQRQSKKLSSSGVVLSNDILTLDLAAGTDHSLIMALITVYGLICVFSSVCIKKIMSFTWIFFFSTEHHQDL
ncbi:transmembrane protein, putative [Medicago truncatula]|uniref:Transmembrane protein, putative n=1 Tax=Medicago truncatula TaxID=3880 RepID=A0A072TEH4_MEDTR|nr:transmembrane protein, putative [Medicago truncatula]